jgi:hypothetical protein
MTYIPNHPVVECLYPWTHRSRQLSFPRFYPAFKVAGTNELWYWPNITFKTKDEAYHYAAKEVCAVQTAAQIAVNKWNISRVLTKVKP